MKDGIRVLGVDDAPSQRSDEETFLTGVVYRGTEFVEDIRAVPVDVDGEDATERVIRLFQMCNNPRQIKAVLTDGISFAGFNLVDIREVSDEIDKPVIAVTSNEPDRDDFRDAMRRSGNYDEKFEEMPDYATVQLQEGNCYIQFAGCNREEAERIIRKSIIHGLVPEPIRVAHMIGRGMRSLE